MPKLQDLNEDALGLPHGVFAGQRIPQRLADAAAGSLERSNEKSDGKDFMACLRWGFYGIAIGIFIGIALTFSYQFHTEKHFIEGLWSGAIAMLLVWIIIDNRKVWLRHFWSVIKPLIFRR
jgi:hypothetical protein